MAENPIPGNPAMLKDLAGRLRRGWDTLRGTRVDMTRFLAPGNAERWDSTAATAFRNRAGEVPRALGHAEARFWGTAYHLNGYAEELEEAQHDAEKAQEALDRAKRVQRRASEDWDRLSRTDPESDAAITARRDLIGANQSIGLIDRQLQQAIQRAYDAATRCAAAIGDTVHDPLRGLSPLGGLFANSMAGRDPKAIDLDMARLASNAYDDGPARVGAWRRLSGSELAALGLTPGDLDDPRGSGLRAVVYESNGRYVVAFAGTSPGSPGDWGANGWQGLGYRAEQYGQAASIAEKVNAKVGNNLAFTGHSLGGGLAAYAALKTRRPAVTFNAAGLHDNSLRGTPGEFGGGASPAEARRRAADGLVRAYHVKGEPLTGAQNGDGYGGYGDLPEAVGNQIELSEPDLGTKLTNPKQAGGHGIGTVIDSMEGDKPWTR